MKLTIRPFILAGAAFALSLHVPSAAHSQAPEAHLYCGEKVECSFILWDGHGSRGFVVEGVGSIPIGNAYNGFKFCMQAGSPHAPLPKWPECYGHNAHWQSSGIIHQGTNS